MISRKSKVFTPFRDKSLTGFKYINRHKEGVTALLPGWATDYRIFDSLDLNTDYLISIDFWPFDFEGAFADVLKKYGIKRLSMLGYSLGGFVAAEFASKHHELIDSLTLVGIRRRYKKEEIEEVRANLIKNKKAYLYKFYSRCFYDERSRKRFKKTLFNDYIDEFNLDYLLRTLDYLESCAIKTETLKDINRIKIIHGEHDEIAPIAEALDIKKSLPQAEFVTIKDAGHMPLTLYG